MNEREKTNDQNDMTDASKLEELGLQQAESRLSRDFIFPMKQVLFCGAIVGRQKSSYVR